MTYHRSPQDQSRPLKRLRLTDPAVAEQLPGRNRQPAPVRDLSVGADTDAASDAVAAQVGEPYFANKLAVGAQVRDGREAEQVPELIEERTPLGSVRAALLRQDRPEQREGRAPMDDAEDEDVQRRLSEIAVGAVERERPRRGHAEQLQDEGGQRRIGQLEVAQEALDALVMRRLLRALDGGCIYDRFCEGHHREIADYCIRDVELTREIYYRLTFEKSADPTAN